MGSRLVTSEACTGNIGGPGILGLDAQGWPLIRLGVNSGEGREFVHGRRGVREAIFERGEGASVWKERDILRLKVLRDCGRRLGARGFDSCEEDPGKRPGS